jgi:cobalt-zinc-cadmium efflux system membrane fusion protein
MKNRLLFGIFLVLLSCQSTPTNLATDAAEAHAEEIELTNQQVAQTGIVLGKLAEHDISTYIQVTGKVDVPPQNLISVTVPYGGFIKRMNLIEGSHVKKGEIMAELESTDYIQLQQDFLENKSQLNYLKGEYERELELTQKNLNSKKALQKAQADYLSTQAKVSGLEAKLAMLQLDMPKLLQGNIQRVVKMPAPISGYVTQVHANVGAYVNPRDLLFQIVNMDHMHVDLAVYEKDVPSLAVGQDIIFAIVGQTEYFPAKVHLIGKEITQDRTVRVHGHLVNENDESRFMLGAYVSAKIAIDAKKVLAVPTEAILDFQGKKFIFFAEEHAEEVHFSLSEVKTGIANQQYTEVFVDKDKQQEQIVIKGAYALLGKLKNGEQAGHAH